MAKRLTHEFIAARTKSERLETIKNINFWGSELEDISIIRRMQNLEIVSLSVNNLRTLQDFSHLKNLRELYLRKNLIGDISELDYLIGCENLRVLWLTENPISEFKNYRLIVINILPQLTKLDDTVISTEERKQASNINLKNILKEQSQARDNISYDKANDFNSNLNYEYNRGKMNDIKDKNRESEDLSLNNAMNNIKRNNNKGLTNQNYYNYKNVNLPKISNNNNLNPINNNLNNMNKNFNYENYESNNNDRLRRVFKSDKDVNSSLVQEKENDIDQYFNHQKDRANHNQDYIASFMNNVNLNYNNKNNLNAYKYNRKSNNFTPDNNREENFITKKLDNLNLNSHNEVSSDFNHMIYERKKNSRNNNNYHSNNDDKPRSQSGNFNYDNKFSVRKNEPPNSGPPDGTSANILNCIIMMLRELDDKDLLNLKKEVDKRIPN